METVDAHLLIISRTVVVEDENGLRLQKTDGPHIDRIAASFSQVTVCAPVVDRRNPNFIFYEVYDYRLQSSNVRIVRLPFYDTMAPGILRSIWKYVRTVPKLFMSSRDVHVIFIYTPNLYGALMYFVNFLGGRPLVIYLGGDWEEGVRREFRFDGLAGRLGKPLYTRCVRWLEYSMTRRADAVLVAGGRSCQRVLGRTNRVERTHPVTPIRADDLFVRSDTCQKQPFRLLYVGRLSPGKGVSFLITAVAELRRRYDVRLDILGDHPSRCLVEDQIRRQDLADVVRLHGFIVAKEQLLAFYRNADIFVLPTLNEGFPRVIFEAMSQSLPVVTTKVGGIPYVMKDGVHGLLVTPGSAEELVRAIERVLQDPPLRQRMMAAGLEIARQALMADPAGQAIQIIRHVLNGKDWASGP